MKIFKKYIFFVAVIFFICLFLPLHDLFAVSKGCACYAGEKEVTTFKANSRSDCSLRCATLDGVTEYIYGDVSYGDTLTKFKVAVSLNTGPECLCSSDKIDVTGAIFSGVGAAMTMNGLSWAESNLNHKAVSVGHFSDSIACEQTCANKGYSSFVLGENFLNNISLPRLSSDASSQSLADPFVPGVTEGAGLVGCGRSGQKMCTLCDLIKGFHDIIQYLIKIAIGVALATIAISGGMYAVSVGEPKMIELAKGAMKNALIGLVIILSAWLIINTLLLAIGTRTNLGIGGVTSWGKFECTANSSR